MEVINEQLQARYHEIENNETRWEEIGIEDADYLIVAFGLDSTNQRQGPRNRGG